MSEHHTIDDRLYQALLSLGGMSCASCTSAVTLGLEELPFVRTVGISLILNTASITLTGPSTNIDIVVGKIKALGFECAIQECFPVDPEPGPISGQRKATAPQTFEAVFSIGGMTCASCIDAVTRGLREFSTVKSADVILITNSGTITFEDRNQLDKIVQRVQDLGFECTVESVEILRPHGEDESLAVEGQRPRTTMVKIDGMFCRHCPDKVVEALRSTYGQLVTIDKPPTLKAPVVTFTYQPEAPDFTIRDIVGSIADADKNFTAAVYHPPSIEQRSQAMQHHERHRLLLRLALSVIIAIPTFLIGVVWMSLVPASNHQRMFLEQRMWAGIATRTDWALLFLSTPVMFFAADVFHLRALKEIRALWRRGSRTPILQRLYRFGSMNLLMSAGTSVAYFASIAMLIMNARTEPEPSGMHEGDTTTYFDSVVFLTMFILIGRYLEAYSKAKTGDAVTSLGKLRPSETDLVISQPSKEWGGDGDSADGHIETSIQRVSVDLLEAGDIVSVPHGASPPADGVLASGTTQFDESSLTGESRAVTKMAGDQVFAGTINQGNVITVKVTGIGGGSMLDQIVRVVREGQTKRAPVERVADTITAYFVPVITLVAIITFVVWFSLGQSGAIPADWEDSSNGGWAFWSLQFAIAVFVVACPCGIGLAAPTALFVGAGLAAKHGILVRGGGEAFQEASSVDAVVFDKTGTLTEDGSPSVTDHEIFSSTPAERERVWSVAQALEEASSHPIARAMVAFCSQQPRAPIAADSVEEVPGRGLRGTFTLDQDGEKRQYEAMIGSEAFVSSLICAEDTARATESTSSWKASGNSVALLAIRSVHAQSDSQTAPSSPQPATYKLAGVFATTTPLRDSAKPTIAALREMGLAVYMLTGDNPTTAHAVASTLEIPPANVFAGVLPAEKAARIQWLQAHAPRRGTTPTSTPGATDLEAQPSSTDETKRKRKIAYIGDGTNDAPALATTPVSITLSSGTDIAISSSSFILLTPSLAGILTLLSLSRAVFHRVKTNFAWAVVYNITLVPVAAGVFFTVGGGHWRLSPVWASAAMAASSVSVVASSLALRSRIWGVGFRGPKAGVVG
ncbi:MAG: hypothetical protein M1832_003395 [Thelocarpon impressellum]|nr:MAG: hypothetical protein M1832_003395 [Thelocarpon impressellum]